MVKWLIVRLRTKWLWFRVPLQSWLVLLESFAYSNNKRVILGVRRLVVSDLRSKTKGSRFESGC